MQYSMDYLLNEEKPYKKHFKKYTHINISSEKLENVNSTTDPKEIKKFLNKNPTGRIILLSSCGDLHWNYYKKTQNEQSVPLPKTIHGAHKLLLENYGNILTQNTGAKFII